MINVQAEIDRNNILYINDLEITINSYILGK